MKSSAIAKTKRVPTLKEATAVFQRRILVAALRRTGTAHAAAKQLGISVATMYRLMNKFKIVFTVTRITKINLH
jgi:transcriptional regulator with PAS, ATPase and Fis domain